ncbi:hypothetical protein GCM10009760_23450 [Kitasatospora kazusensis]|uniref:CBM6 domain-containing protein n=1 Tax=Kitasatospora kazusensis TaxID=407974 RepID=A0ABP5L4Q2_9ACTN
MTTAGSNGAPEDPADDDPFAYLYRPAEGEAAASQPRNSYARPMEVGRAQYGQPQYRQQPPQAQPPYAGAPQQHAGQQPHAPQHAQPTGPLPQQSRYAERSRPQPGEERPSGGRGKAAVIGAVAVVAAIAIGAGIALSGGDPGKKDTASAPHSGAPATHGSASAPASPSASPSASAAGSWAGGTTVGDASGMTLSGGSRKANQVAGAKSAGGTYVDGMNTVGSTVSWDVNLSGATSFQIWLRFNNTGANATATVSVDGTPTFTPIKLNNYSAGSPPEASWYPSWVSGTVTAPGKHTISVSCGQSDQCGFLLDQVAITDASGSGAKPAGW